MLSMLSMLSISAGLPSLAAAWPRWDDTIPAARRLGASCYCRAMGKRSDTPGFRGKPLLLLAVLLLTSCTPKPSTTPDSSTTPEAPTAPESPTVQRGGAALTSPWPAGEVFVDATGPAGIDFVHWNGMSGAFYMPENMGGGGALFDADDDGDLDLYLLQGRMLGPGKTPAESIVPPPPGPVSDRFYRNELIPLGTLRFTDVTAAAGLSRTAGPPPADQSTDPRWGYAMGAAAGDYDNDGRVDLYLSAFGSNRLLRNQGPGPGGTVTFEDVTAAAGVDDGRWSVATLFFDYDRDGWLDLYIGNYLDFTFKNHRPCTTRTGVRDYCDPDAFAAVPDRLLRNRGRGKGGTVTFEDVTVASGLSRDFGKALGAVAADLDGDGWLDLYVANDGTPNQLWLNQGDGTFRDEALFAGCALSGDGRAESSMGLDAADFDGDSDLDLFMTHFTTESHTLYRNDGGGFFEDVTAAAGLAAASLDATGFGTAFLDVDNDGVLDLLAVNGAVRRIEALGQAGDPYPFHQTNQLFRGRGDGRFEQVGGGAAFDAASEVSRAALFGDVDNDGDGDVVVVNNSGPARLWRNAVGQERGWIGLRLVHGEPPRDALGARVGLVRPGRATLWQRVASDRSYAAANDPRVLFGLGEAAPQGDGVVVHVVWPDGTLEVWSDVPVGVYTTLRQGGSGG